jgi:DNA invertase Pin-like site-specific DNA recombinase
LKNLISDVLLDRADFDCILVYDVSRWGRFQDADESAHYEFICKQAGVRGEYCAEEFQNDGSLMSTA